MRLFHLPMCLAWLGLVTSAAACASQPGLPGHYEYRDREMAGVIDLREDGGFTYRIDQIGPPVEGEEPLHMRVEGVWQARDDGTIALANRPSRPPGFERVAARRDPSILAAITVDRTDGRPASGLSVDAGDAGSGYANVVTDGEWSLPLSAGEPGLDPTTGKATPAPPLRSITISREGDDRLLATVAIEPGGPNRFAFRYRPSPVEPFRLEAAVDPKTGILHVEAGQASLPMRRTGPAR